MNNCPTVQPSHQPAGSAESLAATHTKLMLHIDLVILTDWLLDGSSVAGAGGGACGRDMNVHNHDPGNMKTLTSSKTLSRRVLIRSLGICIEHIR